MTTGEIIPATRPAMMAGGRVAAVIPQSMEDCYRLATAVVKAGMAPKGLETVEKVTVAMLHGLEVGLTPMAALQRIAVVNGRPTIWGDGAIGLVRASGLCEYITETVDGSGDAAAAICEAKRRGEPKPIKRTFSITDAKKAGLWGKQGPWQQYPHRMLSMRARAFCLRDGFADVLGGLYIREEIEEDAPRRAAPTPAVSQSAPAPMLEHRSEPQPPATRRAPAPPQASAARKQPSIVEAFAERAQAAQTHEELGAAWNEVVEAAYDAMPIDQQEECERINRHRFAELPAEGDDRGEENGP